MYMYSSQFVNVAYRYILLDKYYRWFLGLKSNLLDQDMHKCLTLHVQEDEWQMIKWKKPNKIVVFMETNYYANI